MLKYDPVGTSILPVSTIDTKEGWGREGAEGRWNLVADGLTVKKQVLFLEQKRGGKG